MLSERQGISVQAGGEGEVRSSRVVIWVWEQSWPEYEWSVLYNMRGHPTCHILGPETRVLMVTILWSSAGLDMDDFTFLWQFNSNITQG